MWKQFHIEGWRISAQLSNKHTNPIDVMMFNASDVFYIVFHSIIGQVNIKFNIFEYPQCIYWRWANKMWADNGASGKACVNWQQCLNPEWTLDKWRLNEGRIKTQGGHHWNYQLTEKEWMHIDCRQKKTPRTLERNHKSSLSSMTIGVPGRI